MEIIEKDLEDLIFGALEDEPSLLYSIGFKTSIMLTPNNNRVFWARQVNLKGYGIADIIGCTRHQGRILVDIIELKNVPLTTKDFDQVFRYETAIREIIQNTFKGYFYPAVNCYLVGPSIESGHYIQNSSRITLYTFKYGLHGFKFEAHTGGWHRGDEKLTVRDIRYNDAVEGSSLRVEAVGSAITEGG